MDIAPLAVFLPVCAWVNFAPRACRGDLPGKRCAPIYGTLRIYSCGVLRSLGQSCPSLARGQRTPLFLPERGLYGAWTQNLPHDPPHACPTPDAPGVATGDEHPCRTGPTRPDDLTHGRWGPNLPHCRHGRNQPPLCLQMGAAVSRAGRSRLGHHIGQRPSAPGLHAGPGGTARGARVTRLGLSQSTWERVTKEG